MPSLAKGDETPDRKVGAQHAVPGGFERTTSPEHGHRMLCPYIADGTSATVRGMV